MRLKDEQLFIQDFIVKITADSITFADVGKSEKSPRMLTDSWSCKRQFYNSQKVTARHKLSKVIEATLIFVEICVSDS